LIEVVDTSDLFHNVFAGEEILLHPRFVRNLMPWKPMLLVRGRRRKSGGRPLLKPSFEVERDRVL
jgi:hypothetical protein